MPKKLHAPPKSAVTKPIVTKPTVTKPTMKKAGQATKKRLTNNPASSINYKKLVKRCGYWSAVAATWSIIFGIGLVFVLAADLPDLKAPPPPGINDPRLVIRTQEGIEIKRVGPRLGESLQFDEMPTVLINAFLAIEDRSFFSHLGVDVTGIARAALRNISSGRRQGGGSTITQQLAKNLFLSFEKTYSRKAQELLISIWLEQEYSKEEILALYLNRIYFGAGAYGVDAASWRYFGHTARTLSIKEAAMLAGIVKSPTRYAPHLRPEASWKRAQVVLAAMADTGIITEMAANALGDSPPRLVAPPADRHLGYFTDWITQRVAALTPGPGKYNVYTTLDPTLQANAHQAVTEAFKADTKASEGALISLDTDGAIRAMVGGRNYGESQYNRATSARRQPGSAFKLFSYLAALENGASPSDRSVDEPIKVGNWQPKNYSGRNYGPMSLREAFARSINTVAVKVAEKTGREKVAAMAKRLGIKSRVEAIASLPLGTEEVSLLELANAYAMVANGGIETEPYAILEIRDDSGGLVYRRSPLPLRPVLRYDTVADMTDMLTAVMTTGTGRRAQIDRPAGGKSGTTQDNRDAVFVGFTADLITGVWTGNDDYSPMPGVTGGGLPATIWKSYNLAAHAGKPARPLLVESRAR